MELISVAIAKNIESGFFTEEWDGSVHERLKEYLLGEDSKNKSFSH